MDNVTQWMNDVTVMCKEINNQVRTVEILTLSEEESTARVLQAISLHQPITNAEKRK